MEIKDERGKELEVGDRVYVPAQPWCFRSSLVSKPVFYDNGEESMRPSVRGRIVAVGFSEKWDAPYIEIATEKGYNRFSWPELARKQAGRSAQEKERAKFQEINAGREANEADARAKARNVKRKGA